MQMQETKKQEVVHFAALKFGELWPISSYVKMCNQSKDDTSQCDLFAELKECKL